MKKYEPYKNCPLCKQRNDINEILCECGFEFELSTNNLEEELSTNTLVKCNLSELIIDQLKGLLPIWCTNCMWQGVVPYKHFNGVCPACEVSIY